MFLDLLAWMDLVTCESPHFQFEVGNYSGVVPVLIQMARGSEFTIHFKCLGNASVSLHTCTTYVMYLYGV